eukprot:m.120448 g.120448  ORF g.120448 m.120448 type:complete len:969 (+) comp16502_c2_seq3:1091-3997(+)
MVVDCPACGARTVRGAAESTPALGVAAAVVRRHSPKLWPSNGLPVNYVNYLSLYDILLIENAQGEQECPRAATQQGVDPMHTAQKAWNSIVSKRAVFVDCVTNIPTATSHLLYFLPVDHDYESGDLSHVELEDWPEASWHSMASVVDDLHRISPSPALTLAPLTRLLLASLDRWLIEVHHLPQSVLTLWYTSSGRRHRKIVQNPSFGNQQNPKAMSVSNPLFQSGFVFPPDEHAANFARTTSEVTSPTGVAQQTHKVTWGDRFPLHRAACEGDSMAVRELIQGGWAPTDEDDDSWTPLHYGCWYGREGVVRVLMEDWQGGPSLKTESGATALHFAARNGFPDIVRVLLACPIVEPTAKDNDGQTALSLCESMQQRQWQEVASLLRNPEAFHAVNRFQVKTEHGANITMKEHRIRLLDGSVKVVRVPAGHVSVRELRDAVGGLCHVPEAYFSLFNIWICSPDLQVSLRGDQNVAEVLRDWPRHVEHYCEASTVQANLVPALFFRRAPFVPLREERKTRSPVAIKLLYDQALHNLLSGNWPVTLDQAVHLAGLLMQIRFGDFDPDRHKRGFLLDDLNTFVPPHLLHNQLKTSQWESRIFASHQQNKGKTDILLLHRLFLQYCWQWPFYNGTFFNNCELARQKGRTFGAHRNEPLRLSVGPEWVCFTFEETSTMKLALSYDELRPQLDELEDFVTIQLHCDQAKLVGLDSFLKGQHSPIESLHIISKLAAIIHQHLSLCLEQTLAEYRAQEQRRVQQRGTATEEQSSAISAEARAERNAQQRQLEMRKAAERQARYRLIQSIGERGRNTEPETAAEVVFNKYALTADRGKVVKIADLKNLAYDLGYWLGAELDGARQILDSAGTGVFHFRDFVSWWSQSKRNWLFLMDDAAFRQRVKMTELFQKQDPNQTGNLFDERITALIKALRKDGLTQRTEESCQRGLDPYQRGVVMFNDFIDWCAHQGLVAERELS